LYYKRTVFLIYVERFLEMTIWLVSSALAVLLVAAETQARLVWFWLSILFLWSGIAVGTFAIVGVVGQEVGVAGSLATLAGCVLAGLAVIKSTTSPSRGYFTLVFLLVLSLSQS
jgi:hypothetical protein